jgi:hypothetical protein
LSLLSLSLPSVKKSIQMVAISERKFSVLMSKGAGVFGSLGQSEDLLDSKDFKIVATGKNLNPLRKSLIHGIHTYNQYKRYCWKFIELLEVYQFIL